MKEKLFICTSELEIFKTLHPEYNEYKEVYNKYGELAGYVALVVKDED